LLFFCHDCTDHAGVINIADLLPLPSDASTRGTGSQTFVLSANNADLISCDKEGMTRARWADYANLNLIVHRFSLFKTKNPTITGGLNRMPCFYTSTDLHLRCEARCCLKDAQGDTLAALFKQALN
jgi:hypothetical protein